MTDAYAQSGVSLARGDRASTDARNKSKKTHKETVVYEQGLAGLALKRVVSPRWQFPCLYHAVDGVGTKQIYAAISGELSTIGKDLVAMVVDDLARYDILPISFCIYRGTNKIDESILETIFDGIVDGCREANVPILGGETAEMPDFYIPPHFEIVGFASGIIEHGKLRKGQDTKIGDLLIGLPSNGLGSNGFSKLRDIWSPWDVIAGNSAANFGDILEPTPIYCLDILAANREFSSIRGWAHITGGGLGESGKLAQLLPRGMAAVLDYSSWFTPDIYEDIENGGGLSKFDMANTFNLGLIMVAPLAPEDANKAVDQFKTWGIEAAIVGKVVEQTEEQKVIINW